MYSEPDKLRHMIEQAREVAASIRLRHDNWGQTEPDARKAATLLLALADELEGVLPELRADATKNL